MKAKKDARLKERENKSNDELAKMLSIRERLENKLLTDEISIELKDNIGKFKVRFRPLSTKTFDEFNRRSMEFGKVKEEADKLRKTGELIGEKKTEFDKKDQEHSDYIYRLFEEHSHDGLDMEFWRNGDEYPPGFLKAIMQKIFEESASKEKYLKEVESFRDK